MSQGYVSACDHLTMSITSSLICVVLIIHATSHSCAAADSQRCVDKCICTGSRISCTNQKLRYVPPDIDVDVTRIDLAYNDIKRIRRAKLRNYNATTTLVFHHNDISSIDDMFFTQFPNLESLDLSYNKLRTLSQANFNGAHNIRELNLEYNSLVYVEGAFNGMLKLQNLFLSHN